MGFFAYPRVGTFSLRGGGERTFPYGPKRRLLYLCSWYLTPRYAPMITLDKTMLRYQIAFSLVKGLGTKGTRLFLQHIHNLEEAFTHPE